MIRPEIAVIILSVASQITIGVANSKCGPNVHACMIACLVFEYTI